MENTSLALEENIFLVYLMISQYLERSFPKANLWKGISCWRQKGEEILKNAMREI